MNNLFSDTNVGKNFKKSFVGGSNANLVDIIGFFADNNLNFPGFCDLLLYLQNNFIKEQKFKYKYQIVIIEIKVRAMHNVT